MYTYTRRIREGGPEKGGTDNKSLLNHLRTPRSPANDLGSPGVLVRRLGTTGPFQIVRRCLTRDSQATRQKGDFQQVTKVTYKR